MTVLGYVLIAVAFFAIGLFFYFLCWRAIFQMVDACRADDALHHFSRLWWISAWRYHKRRFPESDLRRRIVLLFATCWVLAAMALGFIAASSLTRHWPR
jgi:hypothetical protein